MTADHRPGVLSHHKRDTAGSRLLLSKSFPFPRQAANVGGRNIGVDRADQFSKPNPKPQSDFTLTRSRINR
ncbi:unnamed protein product, partial [Nesidiocoris tenuis]